MVYTDPLAAAVRSGTDDGDDLLRGIGRQEVRKPHEP